MLVSAMNSLAAGGLALGFLYAIGVSVLLVGLALLSVATYGMAILPHGSAYLVAALVVIVFGEIGVVWWGWSGSRWVTSSFRRGVQRLGNPCA